MQYVKAPLPDNIIAANQIHIPVGQPVDIDLTSADVIHSFFVPTLHGKVDLIPDQMNRIRIQASQPVVAQAPADYEAWYAHQVRDAQQPVTAQEQQGKELFETKACSLCRYDSRYACPGPRRAGFDARRQPPYACRRHAQ